MKLLHNHRILCYICVIVIAGVLLHDSIWGRTELEEPMSMQGQSEGASMTLTGEVYQIEQKEYSQYIYLEEQENKWLLYDSTFQELALGNTIMITGQLELFDVARNPGNFDIKEYYNKQGIVAGVSIDSIEIVNASVYPIREFLYQIKTTGIEQIYGILGEEQGGILVAMIFGETSGMDADQKELYQKVGISHIFAISGLHISLLSLVVYQLLRRLTGSIAISGIIGGVLLACYVVMIGFGVSAIRASVMFLLRIGADISGRVYDIRISLAVAALCILVPNPNYLYDCGFLMSFGAIIGVIYFVPIWQEVLEKIIIKFEKHKYYKILKHMSEGLAASLGIQCMIMPVLLYYYYEISPYSILLNLLVIPLMTILLGVAMLGLLGSFIWYGIGVVLLGFSGWLLQIIELAGEVTLSLIFSRIISGKPWFLMMILYYVCLLFLLGYWSFIRDADGDTYTGTKKQRIVAMGILVLPGLLWIQPAEYSYPQITMLDIGQGDCFYIRGPEGTDYLIDGGSSDISEVGKYRIEPYLRSIGVDKLEYVLVSHGDIDHYSGIAEMLERQMIGVQIETLVVCPEQFWDDAIRELVTLAMDNDTKVAVMEEGDVLTEGDMSLTYLAPTNLYEGEIGNASSMVLELQLASFNMLFTGDVEGEGEEMLTDILETEALVLKVSHHGSKNSTSEEFLDIVQPKIALISAGIDSIYGHPHEETIEKLLQYNCMIYSTPIHGGVVLSYNVNNDKINIYKTIEEATSQ